MKVQAKTLPHNPNAVYLTSTGWQYPDGSFKPHAEKRAVPMHDRPRWRWLR